MIIVLLADGFEEIEALTPVDMLRRAGITVKTVGIGGKIAVGSHGIPVICDLLSDEVNLNDVSTVIFPGGMPGALNLDASPFTDKVIEDMMKKGGRLAAICAAPLILGRRGLLRGKRATCYPGFENELVGASICECGVVTDGFITTAKGMGVSFEFSEELISLIASKEKAEQISSLIMEKKPEEKPEEKPEKKNVYEYGDEISEEEMQKQLKTLLEELSLTENEQKESPINQLSNPEFYENEPDHSNYMPPRSDSLRNYESLSEKGIDEEIRSNSAAIQNVFEQFKVSAEIKDICVGPRFSCYELLPEKNTKITKIVRLEDDLALALAAEGFRIVAPIPGKSCVGLEIANLKPETVGIKDVIESPEFTSSKSVTTVCIGKDIYGNPIIGDVAKMPHTLIFGAPGVGKSVLVNSMLVSMLFKASPDEVKFIIIDTKQVQFSAYNGLPHLLLPVITDIPTALGALNYAVFEMERRYELLNNISARNIDFYNDKIKADPSLGKPIPKIIIVIDDIADLTDQMRSATENLIVRIAQKSRAVGIHLIICSAKTASSAVSSAIKINIPARMVFKLPSSVDSRAAMETRGAERLLDKGDMLYCHSGMIKPLRVQAALITDAEVVSVLEGIKGSFKKIGYNGEAFAKVTEYAEGYTKKRASTAVPVNKMTCENALENPQFTEALKIAVLNEKVSTSLLQRKLSIGYAKAVKFIEIMEEIGIIGQENDAKTHQVLNLSEWKFLLCEYDDKSELQKTIKEKICSLSRKRSEDECIMPQSKYMEYLSDALFVEAVKIALDLGKIATSLIQHKLSVGYGKAAKFIDMMEDMGIIGESDGPRPRTVLITQKEWDDLVNRINDH